MFSVLFYMLVIGTIILALTATFERKVIIYVKNRTKH